MESMPKQFLSHLTESALSARILITAVGRFFASIISLVGIGIIAIPTGIIAAGFNQVINKEQDKDSIEAMSDDDLLVLQGKLSKLLSERGYTPIISKKEEPHKEAR